MKLSWTDALISLWVLLCGAAFVVPIVWGVGRSEPDLVGRCVYLVVVTAGVIGLALRAIGATRRS